MFIRQKLFNGVIREVLNRHTGLKPAPETPDPDYLALPPEAIAKNPGLEQEQYLEIRTEFIEEKKKVMEDLESALARGVTELISRLAHKIKGAP